MNDRQFKNGCGVCGRLTPHNHYIDRNGIMYREAFEIGSGLFNLITNYADEIDALRTEKSDALTAHGVEFVNKTLWANKCEGLEKQIQQLQSEVERLNNKLGELSKALIEAYEHCGLPDSVKELINKPSEVKA